MLLIKVVEKMIDYYFAHSPRKLSEISGRAKIKLIAHRGAHDQFIVENTHAAFERAITLGCFGIEFDVHATKDGVLVVNHDPNLKRLWGKDVAIKDLNFTSLRQLAPDLPSLAEMVERYGKRIHLFIELKSPFNSEHALNQGLQLLIPGEDYYLLSLDESIFASITTFPPQAMLLVASHNNMNLFYQRSVQKYYGGVLGHYLLLTDRKIKQLQDAKKIVGIGQVNSKFGLYRELNRGMGLIFSNNVALLSRCLQELQIH